MTSSGPTSIQTYIQEIRWPEQPQSEISCQIQWTMDSLSLNPWYVKYLPITSWVYTASINTSTKLSLIPCHDRCENCHHLKILPSNASFIWLKRHNWHQHFCPASCFRHNRTRSFWFESYFIIEFKSDFLI